MACNTGHSNRTQNAFNEQEPVASTRRTHPSLAIRNRDGERLLGIVALLRRMVQRVDTGEFVETYPSGYWFRLHHPQRDGVWPICQQEEKRIVANWAQQQGGAEVVSAGPGNVWARSVEHPRTAVYEGP